MSSAGAFFETAFRGTCCAVLLENQDLYGNHNYISVVVDGNYLGRIRIDGEKRQYTIAEGLKDTVHTLLVCKATESQIGYVDFTGLICDEIVPRPVIRKRKIEFIGNSITCGMGLDMSGVPCDSGKWFDQHNAYLAYGPLTARALDADWLLSAVSGIGVIRNWNSPGPVMPAVYGNLFLNTDSTVLWNRDAYVPDLVSICLGTNDFSDGDGTVLRQPPDSAAFVDAYVRFVRQIRRRYPEAEICLLTSPMNPGEKSVRLENFIRSVLNRLRNACQDDRVHMFVFPESYTGGCDYHPDEAEHRKMAAELLPFYKKVMSW
jgi:lysophospholipase L1-like esterase